MTALSRLLRPLVLLWSALVAWPAFAGSWTTGDVDDRVIAPGQLSYSSASLPAMASASLTLKYGLWNSPDVPLEVYLNGSLVGTVVADQGFSSPGPEYETWDVTTLVTTGVNAVRVDALSGGEAVVGSVQIDWVDSSGDGDGDGFTAAAGDCDDGDPTVFPGAVEVTADGIDQDCDGGELCHHDSDDDGYGGVNTIASVDLDCDDAGEDWLETDCNDADASIHPGALELVADGIDSDCDGGDLCFGDSDGDGYGGPIGSVPSADVDCTDAGESEVGTDCDDADATVHPGATEVHDGVDNDCDGGVDNVDDDPTTPVDSGTPDSGLLTTPPEYKGSSCGCTHGPRPGLAAWLAIVGLVGLRRRR